MGWANPLGGHHGEFRGPGPIGSGVVDALVACDVRLVLDVRPDLPFNVRPADRGAVWVALGRLHRCQKLGALFQSQRRH